MRIFIQEDGTDWPHVTCGCGNECYGGVRREVGFAALTRAFDEAAREDGVNWNPNLGPIIAAAIAEQV